MNEEQVYELLTRVSGRDITGLETPSAADDYEV